jgi:hypothetical protein
MIYLPELIELENRGVRTQPSCLAAGMTILHPELSPLSPGGCDGGRESCSATWSHGLDSLETS